MAQLHARRADAGCLRLWLGRVRAGLPWVLLGSVGTAIVRPHMALMYLAGLVLATAVSLVVRRTNTQALTRRRWTSVVLLILGIAALGLMGRVTLQFLKRTRRRTNPSHAPSATSSMKRAARDPGAVHSLRSGSAGRWTTPKPWCAL